MIGMHGRQRSTLADDGCKHWIEWQAVSTGSISESYVPAALRGAECLGAVAPEARTARDRGHLARTCQVGQVHDLCFERNENRYPRWLQRRLPCSGRASVRGCAPPEWPRPSSSHIPCLAEASSPESTQRAGFHRSSILYLPHAPRRQPDFFQGRRLCLLDKPMQKHHVSAIYSEEYPGDSASCQTATRFM